LTLEVVVVPASDVDRPRLGPADPRREPDTDTNLRRVNMCSTEESSEATTRDPRRWTLDTKFEVAVAPVSGVDRARFAH
jgi:hypothetical protein